MFRLRTRLMLALAVGVTALVSGCSDAPKLTGAKLVTGGARAALLDGGLSRVAMTISDSTVDDDPIVYLAHVSAFDQDGASITLDTSYTVSWSSSSPSVAQTEYEGTVGYEEVVVEGPGTTQICVDVSNHVGTKVEACASFTVRPPVTFSVSGPSGSVAAGQYTWTISNVAGGTGTGYTYSWKVGTNPVGSGASYTQTIKAGDPAFVLHAIVLDSEHSGTDHSIPITPPPPPVIQVGISGPSSQQPNQACSFSALVTASGAQSPFVNAVPPYTYSWSALGQNGTGATFNPSTAGAGDSYFVSLSVTDANGVTGSASQQVLVGSQYPACPE